MRDYKINEIFYSLQGEGAHAGRAALFIRFAGCNLKCPFCDTDFKSFKVWTIWQTGGEPTLQADDDLCKLLHLYFPIVAIETNGTGKISKWVNFVTISPKDDYCANAECVNGLANEVKVVYDGERSPEFWRTHIKADHYFLQPCDTWDETKNAAIREKLVNYIKEHPQWRLSLQTQKILKIR